jgi:hypothetical protein
MDILKEVFDVQEGVCVFLLVKINTASLSPEITNHIMF